MGTWRVESTEGRDMCWADLGGFATKIGTVFREATVTIFGPLHGRLASQTTPYFFVSTQLDAPEASKPSTRDFVAFQAGTCLRPTHNKDDVQTVAWEMFRPITLGPNHGRRGHCVGPRHSETLTL